MRSVRLMRSVRCNPGAGDAERRCLTRPTAPPPRANIAFEALASTIDHTWAADRYVCAQGPCCQCRTLSTPVPCSLRRALQKVPEPLSHRPARADARTAVEHTDSGPSRGQDIHLLHFCADGSCRRPPQCDREGPRCQEAHPSETVCVGNIAGVDCSGSWPVLKEPTPSPIIPNPPCLWSRRKRVALTPPSPTEVNCNSRSMAEHRQKRVSGRNSHGPEKPSAHGPGAMLLPSLDPPTAREGDSKKRASKHSRKLLRDSPRLIASTV